MTIDAIIVSSTDDVNGNVWARPVTIVEHFNGTVAAIDVTLASTAVMTGEVVAEKIQIDFGASIEGRPQVKLMLVPLISPCISDPTSRNHSPYGTLVNRSRN